MQPNPLTIFFCSIALCFSAQVCAAPPQKPGDIKIEKKSFETKAGKVIKYELGTIFVAENRSDPKSRVIGVGFARFRAAVKTPTAPAMFELPVFEQQLVITNVQEFLSNGPFLFVYAPICDEVSCS